MFSQLQTALKLKKGARLSLDKGVNDALDNFRWLASDITSRPTIMAEVVPLNPSTEGHHDASAIGAGGVWFPGENLQPRDGYRAGVPVLWRFEWPDYIWDRVVTEDNPDGTITNSDLELGGGSST